MSRPVSPDYKNCIICTKSPNCTKHCCNFDYDEFELDIEKFKKLGAD